MKKGELRGPGLQEAYPVAGSCELTERAQRSTLVACPCGEASLLEVLVLVPGEISLVKTPRKWGDRAEHTWLTEGGLQENLCQAELGGALVGKDWPQGSCYSVSGAAFQRVPGGGEPAPPREGRRPNR